MCICFRQGNTIINNKCYRWHTCSAEDYFASKYDEGEECCLLTSSQKRAMYSCGLFKHYYNHWFSVSCTQLLCQLTLLLRYIMLMSKQHIPVKLLVFVNLLSSQYMTKLN